MSRPRLPLVLLAVALLLAGCRFDVTTEVAVAGDGSGRVSVVASLDEEVAAQLATDGLDLAPPGVGAWEVDQGVVDGRREVRLVAAFEDPADLAARVAELSAGLDEQDPSLLDDVRLTVAEDGSSELTAVAGLRLPSSTGVQARGLFNAEDLAALATAGDITASLAVTFPGRVQAAEGAVVAGRTATWQLPVGEATTVTASAGPPSTWDAGWLPAAAGLAGLVALVLVVWAWRRRRRRRRSAPLGSVASHRRSRF